MEVQENVRWRNKSPTPLSSVLKEVQLQIKQIMEFQQGFQTELKALTSTVKGMQPPRNTTASADTEVAAIPSIESSDAQPKARCISQELHRLQLEVVSLERESEQLRKVAAMSAQGSLRKSASSLTMGQMGTQASMFDHLQAPDVPVPVEPSADPCYILGVPENTPGLTGDFSNYSAMHPLQGEGQGNLEGPQAGPSAKRQVFADKDAMLERVMCALAKPEYNVANFYHSKGCCQLVARNAVFDNLTMAVIFFNSIWMAIDMDFNKACSLSAADPIFQIGEHFFCAYFFVEWIIRFGAFRRKQDIFRDYWMIFDGFLATMAVFDTWAVTIFTYVTNADTSCADDDGDSPGAGMLRIFKMVRLCRTARMVRLLRRMPELMIMIKGIVAAGRSVFFTLVLLFVIIYVFSLIFRQLTEKTDVGDLYFSSVAHSMTSLLMDGTLPDQKDIMKDLGDHHFLFGVLAFFFVLLSGLTVLNMLVGVLVEVVGVVAAVEKEEIAASFIGECVTSSLLTARTEENDVKGGRKSIGEIKASIYEGGVEKYEFEILLGVPQVVKTMQNMGVDVVALAELTDYLFIDKEEMPFADLLRLVMQLRGANTTTVKDIIDLRKFILQEINVMTQTIEDLRMDIQGRRPKQAIYQRPKSIKDDRARWAFGMKPESAETIQKKLTFKQKRSFATLDLEKVATEPAKSNEEVPGGNSDLPGQVDEPLETWHDLPDLPAKAGKLEKKGAT